MKTTFVLGAAANFGFDNTGNFPLGFQLANRIQNQIAAELNEQSMFPQGSIGGAISHSPGGLSLEHVEAMRRIENSIVYKDSIDDLVDEWSDLSALSQVAKVCIANEILKSEASTKMCAAMQGTIRPAEAMRQNRDSWFGKILRYANPGARRRDVDKCLKDVRFITFNYDRMLEATLFAFLHHSQNIPADDCRKLISQIEIYHAYGHLGRLPELGGNARFGGFEHREIHAASLGIKTYCEELESGHVDRIRSVVEGSDCLVFLGFGFHEQNVRLLLGDNDAEHKTKCFGTAVDMPDRKMLEAQQLFRDCGYSLNLQGSDCHSLVEGLRAEIFN